VRSDTALYATIQTVVLISLFVIPISTPFSGHQLDNRDKGVNSTDPNLPSPVHLQSQLPIASNLSYARVGERLEHLRSGLLPTSAGSPQVSSSIPAASYDEQLGTSFTQSFTKIAYNVTAVAQSDVSGYGPAYLLNGLGNTGYWYQVGLSYHWPFSAGGYNPGFGMNYEVFSPQGASVFPSSGGGGLSSIQVDSGDTVLLSLNFSASGRNVVMTAKDWNTGSNNSVMFSSERASSFIGLINNFEQNGFFTGLMTEWYHVDPYLVNEGKVAYSSGSVSLSSAWMWMDEFSVAGAGLVFSNATKSPVTFSSSPGQLQPFYSHGAYEAVDSSEFITGFQPPPVQVSRPTYRPTSVDVGQLVTFTCNATGGFPPFSYSWNFGDGSSATGQNVSHAFKSPGIMNVQCTVIDSLQTTFQNATSFIVLSDPSISLQVANPPSVDIGQMVTFTAQATGGSGGYSYLWMGLPTGCSFSSLVNISCQPTITGTFSVTANVTDSNGFSILSSPVSVNVNPDPSVASFTASPSNLDIGQMITFTSSASGGSGGLSLVYYGLPTGCDSANSTRLSCTPTATGTFHVILTVTDSDGFTVSSSEITIAVNSDLVATIVAFPDSIDLGQTQGFSVITQGGTAPFSYSYSMPPLGCIDSNSPSLSCTPSTIGNYTIEAVVSDATGEKSTAHLDLRINPLIRISAFTTSLARVETGQEFTLSLSTTGGTTPLSYSYSGLPPNCSSVNSPVLHCTPSAGGPYLIEVIVTDHAGKTTSSTLNVTVQPSRVTSLTSNQGYLVIGGLITAIVFAIMITILVVRRGKGRSRPGLQTELYSWKPVTGKQCGVPIYSHRRFRFLFRERTAARIFGTF
jgi:PKD repeat protein